jgi:hypothetical protein
MEMKYGFPKVTMRRPKITGYSIIARYYILKKY